jgi:drug/metabolite transporter (DMT)-like permease
VTMPLATRILSALIALVGVAMIVSAVAHGGGPLAYGVILGVLFVAVGAGRLWLETRR